MKRAIAALLLALGAAAANAGTGALVDVSVRDLDTGRTLPLYAKAGRWFVPGDPGHRYAVSIENRTGERLLAVLSVDGVNAITGQTAGAHQSGYVLSPWQRTEVRGWRKGMREVAEFYFTDLPDSYAARTDRPDNVGVIGIAVFREQPRWYEPPVAIAPGQRPYERDDHAGKRARDSFGSAAESSRAPAPASAAKSYGDREVQSEPGLARQELGTGHGERRYDPAGYTEFRRASSTPDEIVALHYDDWRALADRGVIPRRWHEPRRPREADPFPMGFAPDPWR